MWMHQFIDTCRKDGATVLLLQRTLQPDGKLHDEIGFYEDMMELLGTGFPRFAQAKTDKAAYAEALLFFFQLQMIVRQLCTADDRLDWNAICLATARYFLNVAEGLHRPGATS